MKIKTKIIIFIALFSALISVTIIQNTYAKYTSSISAETDITVARWNILVNNNDITSSSTFSSTITPTIVHNDYIKDGVIAPTSTGSFDIIIDATNTDVTFQYTISLSPNTNNTVKDLTLTGAKKGDEDIAISDGKITGTLEHSATEREFTITISFEWNDNSETEIMNNSQDVKATKNGLADYDVQVNFIQMH